MFAKSLFELWLIFVTLLFMRAKEGGVITKATVIKARAIAAGFMVLVLIVFASDGGWGYLIYPLLYFPIIYFSLGLVDKISIFK